MAQNFVYGDEVILKNVRLQWADIYRPGDAMEEGRDGKYKVIALMEPDSEAVKTGKQAMIAVAKKLWPNNAIEVVKNMTANSKAIRNGNAKINDDGDVKPEFKNMMFISAGNKVKPRIVGPGRVERAGKKVFVDINEDGTCSINGKVQDEPPYKITKPYRGCYVNLKVKFVAGKAFKGNDGKQIPNQVFAQLIAVQFVKDGIAFGPGENSADGFEDEDVESVDTDGDDDDLMGDGGGKSVDDDGIPF